MLPQYMIYVHLFLPTITKALRNKLNYSIFPKTVHAFVRFAPCKEQSNKWIWDKFNWDRFSDLGWIHFHVYFSNIQTVWLAYTHFCFYAHYYYFYLPTGLFHWAKFFKKSYSGSRVMRTCHFWVQNGPFAPNNDFFRKLLKSLSSTY